MIYIFLVAFVMFLGVTISADQNKLDTFISDFL